MLPEEYYTNKAAAILSWMERNPEHKWVQRVGKIWISNIRRTRREYEST
jgi:hypothetical protein